MSDRINSLIFVNYSIVGPFFERVSFYGLLEDEAHSTVELVDFELFRDCHLFLLYALLLHCLGYQRLGDFQKYIIEKVPLVFCVINTVDSIFE